MAGSLEPTRPMNGYGLIQGALAAILFPAAFALASEIITQEKPDDGAIGVPDLPHPDIRVISNEVGPAHQFDAVQQSRRMENAGRRALPNDFHRPVLAPPPAGEKPS